jgi:hypothetical protein
MGATSYAGGAQASQLSATINNSATAFQVTGTVGWPNTSVGPFVVKVDAGLAGEEKMLISAFDGSGNLTVTTRGYDGTSASGHNGGATIQPCWDATSAQDDNNHVYVTTRNDHTQYLTATSLSGGSNYHDKTARHAFGAALGTPGTPASAWNAAGSAGSASGPARSDHVHLGIPLATGSGQLFQSTGTGAGNATWVAPTYAVLDGTAGDLAGIALWGQSAAAGSAGKAADAGHVHPYTGVTVGYLATSTAVALTAGFITLVYGTAGVIALTLPALSSVPHGTEQRVINTNGTYQPQIQCAGADKIYPLTLNGGNQTYLNVPIYTGVCLMSTGTGWIQVQ